MDSSQQMLSQQASSLIPLRLSTEAIKPELRFEYWRDITDAAFSMAPRDSDDEIFQAETAMFNLGSIVIGRVSSNTMAFDRAMHHVRRSNLDHLCVTIPINGKMVFSSGNSEIRVQSGAIALTSLTKPLTGRVEACDRVVVYVHRDLIPEISDKMDRMSPALLQGGLANVLKAYLLNLIDELPFVGKSDISRLAEATRAILIACIGAEETENVDAGSAINSTLVLRARKYIDAHLAQPISPDDLCKALGVSRSTLYRLFEPLGGVVRYCRRRRLVRCHALLTSQDGPLLIKRVWSDHGFSSAAEFSRAFRREFGYSPTDARSATLPPVRSVASGGDSQNFGEWLRTMRS